jgi:hypothetical protein
MTIRALRERAHGYPPLYPSSYWHALAKLIYLGQSTNHRFHVSLAVLVFKDAPTTQQVKRCFHFAAWRLFNNRPSPGLEKHSPHTHLTRSPALLSDALRLSAISSSNYVRETVFISVVTFCIASIYMNSYRAFEATRHPRPPPSSSSSWSFASFYFKILISQDDYTMGPCPCL